MNDETPLSNCCGARFHEESDICKQCGEHADAESDLLLDVPEQTPRWKELQEQHGIFTHYSKHSPEGTEWSAWDFSTLESDYAEDWRKRDPMDLIGEYCVLIEERGGEIEAPTEREAVITLIHKRQLPGWKEVSL